METDLVRLTQYSHGAGCGCKISPQVLEEILAGSLAMPDNNKLLVGNNTRDDAAVYDLGNGTALVSTTDFFMPIVDDPFDFGRIASANAISDVYAMGGTPVLAIAILGWPVNKLSSGIARKVIDGGRSVCMQAGIPLAGGHSIDTPEPIFGLAVSGIVPVSNLKTNSGAKPGDYIFLTKRLGVGMLTTAEKRQKILPGHSSLALDQMVRLNSIGELLGRIPEVTAMTDVTGFGLGGHLVEIAEGSGASAELYWSNVPLLPNLDYYVENNIYPDGTKRNWSSYGHKIDIPGDENPARIILPDPQTNGGLLFTVKEEGIKAVADLLRANEMADFTQPIGRITGKSSFAVTVLND